MEYIDANNRPLNLNEIEKIRRNQKPRRFVYDDWDGIEGLGVAVPPTNEDFTLPPMRTTGPDLRQLSPRTLADMEAHNDPTIPLPLIGYDPNSAKRPEGGKRRSRKRNRRRKSRKHLV